MRQYPSLVGERFGNLVVESYADTTSYGQRRWLCRCDCGNTCIATTGNLRRRHTTSCGCKKSPDLTGNTYGRLTVLRLSDKRGSRGKRTTPLWECRCECGAITYKSTDTLTNPEQSMCADCAAKYAMEQARKSAGFVGGTQLSKIRNMNAPSTNSSGCRGVYFDKRSNKWRARLKFQGKAMNFGSYEKYEDAVEARRKAEEEYFGTFLMEHNEDNHMERQDVWK